jgi:hypothetical protein
MEDGWTKKVEDKTICGTLEVLFFYKAIGAGLAIITVLTSIIFMPGNVSIWFKIAVLILSLIAIAVPFLDALFTYMLCDRALIAKA